MKVRRTYKYRLYTSKRDKHLHQQIDVSGIIWNHALAVHRRYYRLTGKCMRGKRVVKINQWEPTSQTCSCCGHRQSIELRQRVFRCDACGLEMGRDHNWEYVN